MPSPRPVRRWLRFLPALIALALGAFAIWVLYRELAQHSFAELRAAVAAIPPVRLGVAALLTAASYAVLTGYDALALHTVGIPLPYRKTILASFLGYVFSHNVGLSVLGGSAARFRMYSTHGLTATDVVKVFAFCALTFWLGLLALAGSVLIVAPEIFTVHVPVPDWLLRAIGIVLVGATVAYVYACSRRREPLRFRKWEFPLPRPRLAVLQIGLSIVDWIVAGSVLYALLPVTPAVSFFHFMGVFLTAQLVAVTSHVPGGLGVFDAFVLGLLRDHHPATTILGALLAYRLIYYLAPLAVGIVLLATYESARHAHHARRIANAVASAFGEVSPRVVPRLLAFAAFWSGAVMLYSSATPPKDARLVWLTKLVPLSVVECTHLLGSVLGVLLLFVARGLHERLRGAWSASIALLAIGIFCSFAKGFDWEEATVLALALAVLLPCREHFFRRSSLFRGPATRGWTIAMLAVVAASAVLAWFSFKHVPLTSATWAAFGHEADAPRALRATAAAVLVALALTTARVLSVAPPSPARPRPDELEQARQLARACDDPRANLVLLGDKAILWSPDGDGFVMYDVEGSSWVALGDPVGAPDEAAGLVKRFVEVAKKNGGKPVFHEVLGDRLPLYVERGLATHQVREEPRLELANFALEDPKREELRKACDAAERAGATFELVASEDVAPILKELEQVSREWLARRGGLEKGFASGWFARAWLQRFPIATVRVRGKLVAFANVWLHEDVPAATPATGPVAPTPSREELAFDLLRHAADAPAGTIDFLLVKLAEVARGRRYRWLGLGAEPVATRLLKDEAVHKRARYLAAPQDLALVDAIDDVSALVHRGPRMT